MACPAPNIKLLRIQQDASLSGTPLCNCEATVLGCLQVEGAFIQGLGLFTSEEVITDENTGRLITDGTWEYKIPAATCIPRQFNATFLKVPPLT